MSRHVFRCESARIPPKWKSVASVLELGNENPPLDLKLELPQIIEEAFGTKQRDLVRIAAYCYFADQSVSRGGLHDVNNVDWRREMLVAINVENPDLWRSSPVLEALKRTLGFLTDDSWDFSFSIRRPSEATQLRMFRTDAGQMGDVGCVSLFSGGADSLAAAVDAYQAGLSPLLVSHRSSSLNASWQNELVRKLRERLGQQQGFSEAHAWVHRKESDARETSQRSRSFLFASLAVAVASCIGLTDVRLADNGVVSVNLPLTAATIGAQASRSTHPHYLRLICELATLVFEDRMHVHNPFWNKTRPETLIALKDAGVGDMVALTHSCAHPRGRTQSQPHCGGCSQCVDRRFGMLAAGLGGHDPAAHYAVEIFREGLPEGEPRTIALSYVRLARKLNRLSEEDILAEFQELNECVDWTRADAILQAREIAGMLKRHARDALAVLKDELVSAADALVSNSLPQTCLVRLCQLDALTEGGPGAASPLPASPSTLICGDDYATVRWMDQPYHLGNDERAAFALLHQGAMKGFEVSGETLKAVCEHYPRSISELFRPSRLWKNVVIDGVRRGNYRIRPEAL